MSSATEKITPNEEKFAELLLYVCMKSQEDEAFGATKLNKVLFFSDFLAYLQTGKPITGCDYQKLDFGPAPRCLLRVASQLEAAREIGIQHRMHYGKPQKRTVALREADLSAFSGAEIALVDRIIEKFWGKSATDVSELSHTFIGWQLVDTGESIPYSTVFIDPRKPTAAERAYGAQLANEIGI